MFLGTRGSELALKQAQEVLDQLQAARPQVRFQIRTVTTSGDARPNDPIDKLGIGAFVKELEVALQRREIDVAIHSLKDVPVSQPVGMTIAAVTRRDDPRDVLVNRWELPLDELPKGARIGTGSPRRAAQLLNLRPDIEVLPIRGSVVTRLEKSRGKDYDGVVVALAGLRRLGRQEEVAQVFAPEVFVPAPGQGALGLEIREEDEELAAVVRTIQDPDTAASVQAERALLMRLGGGCRAPFGAYASIAGEVLTLTAVLAEETGTRIYKVTAAGRVQDPEAIANEAHRQLMDMGVTTTPPLPGGGGK
ncbi:MAG: hydroxymethylbilane synthase [Dehalococcoidia bacterium]